MNSDDQISYLFLSVGGTQQEKPFRGCCVIIFAYMLGPMGNISTADPSGVFFLHCVIDIH